MNFFAYTDKTFKAIIARTCTGRNSITREISQQEDTNFGNFSFKVFFSLAQLKGKPCNFPFSRSLRKSHLLSTR